MVEEHKDRFSGFVGAIAWRAIGMPAEERQAYILLMLQRARELYALKAGALPPKEDEELADHLQKWTEESVRMLERGRDDGLSAGAAQPRLWTGSPLRNRIS